MTSGCTLHETFATVVARRNTTPVEVREPKGLDTMVMRFPVHEEAKVDVADYLHENFSRARQASVSAFDSQYFPSLCWNLRRGKESGQRQPCCYRVKITGIMKARRSDRRARQIKCANRIAVRAGCVKNASTHATSPMSLVFFAGRSS
jgi:hypothetical protein